MLRFFPLATRCGVALLTFITVSPAQADSEGVFTAAQAQAGRTAYEQYCVECHHGSLRGTGHGPPLQGAVFVRRWSDRTTDELIQYISQFMSTTVPSSVTADVYPALAAHILSSNTAPAGSQALKLGRPKQIVELLPTDSQALAAATDSATAEAETRTWEGASGVAEAAARASSWVNGVTPELSPVTDEMLRNPPAESWLNWRRTQDGQGFSPLSQINNRNVGKLRLAWTLTIRDGSNQVTPLVHDGIMFLTHPANVIQALDAATGTLIWEYAYPHPADARTLGGPTRNIAIYQDRLFIATYDAALIALDARTGKLLWRTTKADYTKGYTHTAGPLIADGVVISGINGCERFKDGGCFITGHDPQTGQELWRTSTIALPGDPNDITWAGVPPEYRGGGDNWIAGTYDPELKLVFLGTSQAKPWVAASRGMTVDAAALYTNSTLALEPRTGKLRWFFQHMPGETLDMETGFERVLIDLAETPYVVTVGKDGIIWKLNRKTGKFVDFAELLPQNIFERPLNRETGRLVYRADIANAKIGDTVEACPSIYGGHNWQASAYAPSKQLLIVPLHQICMTFTGRQVDFTPGGGGYGGESTIIPMPGAEGMLGRLTAVNMHDLSTTWTHTQRAMFLTGVLNTAGDLTFVGDLDRYFKAFDTNTGEVLWQSRLGAPLHGYPVSYAVNGKQYVAVPTGMGVFKLMTARQAPDIYQPPGGNALYVFELMDSDSK
jgi:alcohol dehydrogenase (cytochrome c)